jgi:HAD superfamily hydrolase (TIGR01509 family)
MLPMTKVPKVSSVLIDLDGTLRDTRDLIYGAYQHAIRTHADKEVTQQDIKPHVHHHTVVHKAFADHVEEDEFYKTYAEVIDPSIEGVPLYEGTEELLAYLRKNGLKSAIVTSAPQLKAENYLKAVGLYDKCDTVVGVSPDRLPKPAPDMLIEALRQLNVKAEESIMLGDMAVDSIAANAAGIRCIGVTHGFATREELKVAGAEPIFDSLLEVIQYLEGLR